MKIKSIIRKSMLAFLGTALIAGVLPGISALNARAEEATESIEKNAENTFMGCGNITRPDKATVSSDKWQGSYVYYGTYGEDKSPVKFRMLKEEDQQMLLDCDTILMTTSYEKKNYNLLDQLNGSAFYSTCLSEQEQSVIVPHTVDGIARSIALLSNSDMNDEYGYYNGKSSANIKRNREGKPQIWWLLKENEKYNTVTEDGTISDASQGSDSAGVSPAFQLDVNKILLLTKTANKEYKLTLLDSGIKVTSENKEGFIRRKADGTVTIPYQITGKDASDVNALSVLATDSDKKIKAYIKTDANVADKKTGTVTFPVSEDMKNCTFYLLAEHRNEGNRTDYASELHQLPALKDEISTIQAVFQCLDGEPLQTAVNNSNITITKANDTENLKDLIQVEAFRVKTVYEDGTESATNTLDFHTSYKAELILKVTDSAVFADQVTVNIDGMDGSDNWTVSEDYQTITCTNLTFTTRKAKLKSAANPTISATFSYTSDYHTFKLQLDARNITTTIETEAGNVQNVPIIWESIVPGGFGNTGESEHSFNIFGKPDLDAVNVDDDGKDTQIVAGIKMAQKETVSVPKVKAKVTQPADGIIYDFEVELTCETEGADIYYTLDGSDPGTNGQKYTQPIAIKGPEKETTEKTEVTLRAVAKKTDYTDSTELKEKYAFAERYRLTVTGGYIKAENGVPVGTDKTEGVYAAGAEVTVAISGQEGVTFKCWKIPGMNSVRSEELKYTVRTQENTLTAAYIKNPKIELKINDEKPDESSEYRVEEGARVQLNANANVDPLYFLSVRYQWFRYNPEQNQWNAITDLNVNNYNYVYSTLPSDADGSQYKCQIACAIEGGGEATFESQVVTIRVNKAKYQLSVENGSVSTPSEDNRYDWDTPVTVTADQATSGQIFDGWTVTKISDGSAYDSLFDTEGNKITDFSSPTLTFNMPREDIKLVANYKTVTAPTLSRSLPEETTVTDGDDVTLTVEVFIPDDYKDAAVTYQWQKSQDGSNYADISGATSAEYSISKAGLELNGNSYKCKITILLNDEKTELETETKLIVSKNEDTLITVQPSSATVQEGDEAEFFIQAEAAEGCTLSYGWQKKDSDGTWKSAGTDSKYVIKNVTKEMDGLTIRCVVKEIKEDGSEGRTETSKEVTLTVSETPHSEGTVTVVGGTADKDSYEAGDKVKIKATIPDGQEFVEWKADQDDIHFEDATDSSTSFEMPERDHVTVTAVFKDGYKIEITGQPENVSVPAGGTATFKVSASSSYEMVYEWKADYNDGKGFQTVGAGPEYSIQNVVTSLNGTRYECIITLVENREISVTSSAAVLTVEAPDYTVKVNDGTASVSSVKPGETVTIKANEAPEEQEFLKWNIISGRVNLADASSMETTFTMPSSDVELSASYQKKLAAPTITTQPEDVTVTTGSSARFKIEASGEELSYQWKVDKKDGNGYEAIAGATNAGYTVYTEDASMNGYQYQCEVKNRAGSVESKEAVLTVEYKITEGARSTWMKSGSSGLSFRGSGEYSKFSYVKVDGDKIGGSNYTKKSGSTIITLVPSYLEKLSSGKHTLTIVWEDGTAETTFTISGTSAVSSQSALTPQVNGQTSSETSSQKDTSTVKRKGNSASAEEENSDTGEEAESETVDAPILSGTSDKKNSPEITSEEPGEEVTDESKNLNMMNLDTEETEGSASVIDRYAAGISMVVILCSLIGIILIWLSRRGRRE